MVGWSLMAQADGCRALHAPFPSVLAAPGRTRGCSPGGRSGHAALFSAHNWQLPPPTQTDPAMFLKCSQQLETKATSVSYWKSPSKAASLPWTTLGHVNSADYPSLTLLIYHPPLLSICSSVWVGPGLSIAEFCKSGQTLVWLPGRARRTGSIMLGYCHCAAPAQLIYGLGKGTIQRQDRTWP